MIVNSLVLLVAFQHFAFCALEMFFWHRPLGRKIFRLTPEQAAQTRALAANQGLYNAFLALGLLLSLVAPSVLFTRFFLGCVVAAGLFGALTVSRRILYVQALPAALALACSLLL